MLRMCVSARIALNALLAAAVRFELSTRRNENDTPYLNTEIALLKNIFRMFINRRSSPRSSQHLRNDQKPRISTLIRKFAVISRGNPTFAEFIRVQPTMIKSNFGLVTKCLSLRKATIETLRRNHEMLDR